MPTRDGDACENINCLVPRCHNRIVPRHRPRDRIESCVAFDRAAGDAILAGNLVSGSDHLVAHCNSLGRDRGLGVILLVAEVSAGCRVIVLLFRVTYATIGYGDLVLPKEWRLFGPVEGLTGILMCGLSTAFLFAILSRMYSARTRPNQD
jgi:hypothetical protein